MTMTELDANLGACGVEWCRAEGRWAAYCILRNDELRIQGYYDTHAEAKAVADEMRSLFNTLLDRVDG